MKVALVILLKYIWRLVAWAVVPIMLLLARPVDRNLSDHDDTYNGDQIPRYNLPGWLKWAETPDMHLPGGLYEPTVKRFYGWIREHWGERVAKYCTGWYWLGWRNAGHGIPWYLVGEPTDGRDPRRDKVFNLRVFYIKYGWKTARDWYSTKTPKGYVAIPRFSLRPFWND